MATIFRTSTRVNSLALLMARSRAVMVALAVAATAAAGQVRLEGTVSSSARSPHPLPLANTPVLAPRAGASRLCTVCWRDRVRPSIPPPRPPSPPPQAAAFKTPVNLTFAKATTQSAAAFPTSLNLAAANSAMQTAAATAKAAIAAEIDLKLRSATVNPAAPRFTGRVTCYVDAVGDVTGLRLGTAPALCSPAGMPHAFVVAPDEYVASLKVAVNFKTGHVGELAFVVKPTPDSAAASVGGGGGVRVISCGTQGGVGVPVMPPLSALASATATCTPAAAAGANPLAALKSGRRRLHAAPTTAIDPASLAVVVTTLSAPPFEPQWILAAAVESGNIFRSVDEGETWVPLTNYPPPQNSWVSIAVSADGTKLVAVQSTGAVWRSTTSGSSWTVLSGGGLPANALWQTVAASADGARIYVAALGGAIWASSDSGSAWTQLSNGVPTSASWYAISCSAAGDKVMTALYPGDVYISTTAGAAWTQVPAAAGVPSPGAWSSVVISGDGST